MKRKNMVMWIMKMTLVWLIALTGSFAFQSPSEFSGDLVITNPDTVIKAKLYVKDPSIHRIEMPAEKGGMVFIRPPQARGRIWMLDPAKKQYRILSWPEVHKDPEEAWTDIQYDMSGGQEGEEVINGYPCRIFHFRYQGEDKIALKMWFSEELQYAIKREADAKIALDLNADPVKVEGVFEVLNIKRQKLDDALFEVPPDYVEVK